MVGLQMADFVPDHGGELAGILGQSDHTLVHPDLAARQDEGIGVRLGKDPDLPSTGILAGGGKEGLGRLHAPDLKSARRGCQSARHAVATMLQCSIGPSWWEHTA